MLVHVARGRSNTETAAALHLAETTVKTHLSRILTKLELRDRAQAIVFAYETRLVQPRLRPLRDRLGTRVTPVQALAEQNIRTVSPATLGVPTLAGRTAVPCPHFPHAHQPWSPRR